MKVNRSYDIVVRRHTDKRTFSFGQCNVRLTSRHDDGCLMLWSKQLVNNIFVSPSWHKFHYFSVDYMGVCVIGFNFAYMYVQQFFSHITMVSGCDKELNAHVHTPASLSYHFPDTWHDTTPCHILTLGQPVLALPRKFECQARSS